MHPPIAQRMQGITSFYVMELLQRAKQLEEEGRDIIHMEIGEPDFATPPAILAAGQACLQGGYVKYTAAAGLPALRQAIADYYANRYGVSLDPRRVFVTPGASGAFLLAFGVSLNAGGRLMMSDPCYPCNANFVRLLGAEPYFINVGPASGYHLDAALIAEHWRDGVTGVLLASPANPSGTLIGNAALQAAIAQTVQLGGVFYADEIYHGLDYGEPPDTALNYSSEAFVINSFSKYFGMTGWRVGWLIVPENFAAAAEKLAQNIFISAPAHSQFAALAAFSAENLAELQRRRDEFKIRRDYLYENLLRLGFNIPCEPEGAFYIYADCGAFTDDSFRFAKDLLEVEGVAVTPGKDFGVFQAEKYIRLAYTGSIDRMNTALTRLERFICR